MFYQQIITPTLLLDANRCKANIHRLVQKVTLNKIELRPHFKTHQSRQIGEWFRQEGIGKITVTSVDMANYFVDQGWHDITIAFPVNVRQVQDINILAGRVKLGLVVVDPGTIDILGTSISNQVAIWIKIDVGTHRTGIAPHEDSVIEQMTEKIKKYPQLNFEGFIGHAGHTYQEKAKANIQRIYNDSVDILVAFKQQFIAAFPNLQLSLGDTPGSSIVDQFGPIDELRPGNFVFYDLMQEEIGSCTMDDIAVAMACPVVAIHPEILQWIIYGGGIHFSKDFLVLQDGRKCFGRMANLGSPSWTVDKIKENPFLLSLSQEHGIVQCTKENFGHAQVGDLTLWLPVHSCMTADAMGEYTSTDGGTIDHYRQHIY